MKKFITILILFTATIFSLQVKASGINNQPSVSADGAILMDAKTGEILYSKNVDTKYPPASTTKLMTALLTFENCNLDDEVTVGKNPPFVEGSKIYLYEGEVLTVRQLLYGLLLTSGNDCAEALAEHIGGSIENFSEMMNEKAKEIGCKNTNFVNPSGLYDDNHRTSAYDLALIMRELIKYPEYIEIATTQSYQIPPTNKCDEPKPLWNENRLIQKGQKYYYESCIGGKTGYTIQSWHSYVAAATKNNQTLIVALLHDTKKTFFSDSISLFNYGFDNFSLEKLYSKDDIVDTLIIDENTSIPVLCKNDFYYVKDKQSDQLPKLNIDAYPDLSSKTIVKGDVISKGTINYENSTLGTIELVAGGDYTPKKDIMEVASKQIEDNSLYIRNFIITIIIFVLLCFIIHFKNKHKEKIKNFYDKR